MAPSRPPLANASSQEPSIGSDRLVDPLNLAKFKSWSPAQLQTILDSISSTEFEKSTTEKYSTERLRQQLNSIHGVANEISPLNLPDDSSHMDVIKKMKAILQIRLESLLSLSIPTTKSRILAKAHAKSGIHMVSLTMPSVQATMKAHLSRDEMLAITSKESRVYKSVQDTLDRGLCSWKFNC